MLNRSRSQAQVQPSVIYMQDRKKFSDMAKFIKRLGDERVACQVYISVKGVKVESSGKRSPEEQDGFYAI